MKNFLLYVTGFVMWFIIFAMGLKACDYEYHNQVAKSEQWQQDIKDGKPFTNYGE